MPDSIRRREFMATAVLAAGLSTGRALSARAAKPDKRIKVGQIGTDHGHAAAKMAALRKLEDEYEVVGIVEPDAELRKAAQQHAAYRDLRWMSEEELLSHKGLRVVAVETTVAQLVPTAQRCVDAGMHIHLDKPAGASLSAFKCVLDQATRRGLTVQMGYMYRHNPAFEFCFQAVRDGWLGEIFAVEGMFSSYSPGSRERLFKQPGGDMNVTMFVQGAHLIDSLVTLLGKPEQVTAYSRRTCPQRDTLLDHSLAVFEYPRAIANIRCSLLEVSGRRRRHFVICGTEGTLDIHPLEPPKLLMVLARPRGDYKQPGYQEVSLESSGSRFDEQLIDLARIARGEKESAWSPSHDLAVHETILRASCMPLQ